MKAKASPNWAGESLVSHAEYDAKSTATYGNTSVVTPGAPRTCACLTRFTSQAWKTRAPPAANSARARATPRCRAASQRIIAAVAAGVGLVAGSKLPRSAQSPSQFWMMNVLPVWA